MDKYKNKYRIPSARAQWWDYGWNGAYFITICTANRKHYFGEIKNGQMQLSHLGVIADILWHEIPLHSKFADLGDFVVMPNHIHGILILNKPYSDNSWESSAGESSAGESSVQTGHALSLQPPPPPPPSPPRPQSPLPPSHPENQKTIGQQRFQNQGGNTVSSIIGGYKSAVTKHANRMNLKNGWQTRFHDHIIRDDAEYQRISNYIINNPENWNEDGFRNG